MPSNLIPYIIIEARPSSYLPSISYIKGIMEENKLKKHLFNLLIQFIQEQTSFANIDTIEKVKMFWNYYYSTACMKNKPWEAFIIKNGIWETVLFEDEDILYALLNKKNCIENDEIIEDNEIIEYDVIIENEEDQIKYYISSDEED